MTQETTKISCEIVENFTWTNGVQKTCYLRTSTINSTRVSLSFINDEAIGAIDLSSNKNIHFLPIILCDESVTRVSIYNAAYCSLLAISKKNFRNLKKLQALYLQGNRIEMVKADTFSDMTSLEYLDLGLLLSNFSYFVLLSSFL